MHRIPPASLWAEAPPKLVGFASVWIQSHRKVEMLIKRENWTGGRTGAKWRMHHNGEKPGWKSRNKMYLDGYLKMNSIQGQVPQLAPSATALQSRVPVMKMALC